MPDTEARYRSLFDSTPDLILIMDDDGIVVDVNSSVQRILGYAPADLVGAPLSRIMPERFRASHEAGFRRYLSSGQRQLDWRSIELPGLCADGREVMLAIAFGEYQEEGRRFFTGILRDISAEKARTALLEFLSRIGPELASSALDYRATLRNLAQMAVPALADWSAVDVVGLDGKVERLGVAHSDPAKVELVKDLESRYPTDPDSPIGAPQVIRTGKAELVPEIPPGLLEGVAKDEHHLEVLNSLGLVSYVIVPLAAHGRIYGALSLVQAESGRRFAFSDLAFMEELGRRAGIAVHNAGLYQEALEANRLLEAQAVELEQQTEEAQAMAEELEQQTEELLASAEALKRTTEEAAAANQAKSAFLASMSHELRTPLNAIGGYVELMEMGLRGPLTEDQRADLARIRVSQRHLLALINDLLNFARVEAGKIEYRKERVVLNEVLRDCEAMLLAQAAERRIAYSADRCRDPVVVCADRNKVQQVLLNLMSNAIKFMGEGGSLIIECDESAGTGRVTVADTGIGIEAEKLETIFEPFVQVNRSLNQPGSGAGLGLAISRSLAQGMGGDVTVKSEPGRGSAFTLSLPSYIDAPNPAS